MKTLVVSCGVFFFFFQNQANALTLNQYLEDVKQNNTAIKSLILSNKAKKSRLDEGSILFKPSFFVNSEFVDDKRPTNAPAFQGTQTLRTTLKTGIVNNFKSGTTATLSYNYFKTQINGANETLLPNKKFFDLAPMLELSQSLWRNWAGEEFLANEMLRNAQAEAALYTDQFNLKNMIIQAENTYWRLYFAKLTLKVQKESLDRANRLKEWNERKVRSNLVDETELLQAQANVQNREMEYTDALSEIEIALKEFNSFRQSDKETTLDEDNEDNINFIMQAKVEEKLPQREDLLAARANQKLLKANSILGRERNSPNLDVYASYAMYGRNKYYSEAMDQAQEGSKPISVVGVRFSTPLDLGGTSDYRDSYKSEVLASELSVQRKEIDLDKDWVNLQRKFSDGKVRLEMAQRLVQLQDTKLSKEKRRYEQGRSTIFQVLQFEQDYANAQLLKLRNERELMAIYNQLKLFTGMLYE